MIQAERGNTKFIDFGLSKHSVLALRLEALCEHVPGNDDFDIGYITPSKQGIRGKTRWIFDNHDVEDMFREYRSAGKSEIIIWCDGHTQTSGGPSKQPTSGLSEPATHKRAQIYLVMT